MPYASADMKVFASLLAVCAPLWGCALLFDDSAAAPPEQEDKLSTVAVRSDAGPPADSSAPPPTPAPAEDAGVERGIVFVTRAAVNGGMENAGKRQPGDGRSKGDTLCADEASQHLKGHIFYAYLSDNDVQARERPFSHPNGWQLPSGKVVTAEVAPWRGGTNVVPLIEAVTQTADGATALVTDVWTGSSDGGERRQTCNSWNAVSNLSIYSGSYYSAQSQRVESGSSCGDSKRVLCVEVVAQ